MSGALASIRYVKFDQVTAVLLILNPDRPPLDEAAEAELQDAHLAYLAELHEAGRLLAAGPLADLPDRVLRGLSLFSADVETVERLAAQDPAVIAGKFTVKVMSWTMPSGAMRFERTEFPRSIADAVGE